MIPAGRSEDFRGLYKAGLRKSGAVTALHGHTRTDREALYWMTVPTVLGKVAVVWMETPVPEVRACLLPPWKVGRDFPERLHRKQNAAIGRAVAGLARGKRLQLGECVPFQIPEGREFQGAVLKKLARAIPRGRVISYGALAAKLGRPRAARAVGQAMAKNPLPLLIPCHRVIASDRTLGGFMGGKNGLALKRRLLEQEGILLDERGRVPSRYVL